MSGPKISYGDISREIYLQYKQKAKIELCIKVCHDYARTMDNSVTEVLEYMDLVNDLFQKNQDFAVKQQEIMNKIDKYKAEVSKLSKEAWSINESYSLHNAESLNEKMTIKIGKVIGDGKAIKKEIDTYKEEMLIDLYSELQSTSYYFAFENATKKYSVNQYISKINEALKEILNLNISTNLSTKLEELKKKACNIVDGNLIHNFYQISIIPFVKECREYDEFYSANNIEFEALKVMCHSLADEVNESIEDLELSQESLIYYRNKSQELTVLAIESRKQAFIKRMLDETMTELGYNLVGSKESINKKGEVFHNHLFSYGEGTAVNVTFSQSGQITMEIGGIDIEDRLPEYAESQKLVESMHAFCSDYARIEDKLKEKGVINNRVSMMPADEDFAQIINVNEYNMLQKVSKFNVNEQTEQKAAYMYIEGDN